MKCIEIITADENDISPLVIRVDDHQAQLLVSAGFAEFATKQEYKAQSWRSNGEVYNVEK